MKYITCVYEDILTFSVMKRILELFSEDIKESPNSISCNGKSKIEKRLVAYNNASKIIPYFIIIDLDTNICAPSLIQKLFLGHKQNTDCIFRVAVREIEAWLLADKKGLAAFLSIPETLIPPDPERIKDPKQQIISLAKRSRKKNIKNGIPPIDSGASIGPEYNIQLTNFVSNYWNINTAMKHSISLKKAVIAIQEFTLRNKTIKE